MTTREPRAAGVVRTAAGVERAARGAGWEELDERICSCRACPRLVAWREQVAREKRASFAQESYWGRPVPGFGATDAAVLVVGLAPAAHGANRTGRVFTGDRSGDWLFASLHRVGLANQPTSRHTGDGLTLVGTRVVAAVRCAPPQNRPTPQERDTCAPFVEREVRLLRPGLRAVVALGGFGWDASLRGAGRRRGPRAPATAPFRPRGRGGAGGPDPPRLLPPLPAEHLHRAAHRADAGRRPGPRRGAGLPMIGGAVATAGPDRPGPGIPTAEEAVLNTAKCGFDPHPGQRCALV